MLRENQSRERKTQRAEEREDQTRSEEDFMEWTKSVWTMPTESAKKVGHPAPFPVELLCRLIELYTFKDDSDPASIDPAPVDQNQPGRSSQDQAKADSDSL